MNKRYVEVVTNKDLNKIEALNDFCLHNDIEKMKDITATSLAEAIKAGLISLDVEYNTIFPLELKKRNKESANVLKMGKNAEKLGQWCAGMNLIQIEEILKVRF